MARLPKTGFWSLVDINWRGLAACLNAIKSLPANHFSSGANLYLWNQLCRVCRHDQLPRMSIGHCPTIKETLAKGQIWFQWKSMMLDKFSPVSMQCNNHATSLSLSLWPSRQAWSSYFWNVHIVGNRYFLLTTQIWSKVKIYLRFEIFLKCLGHSSLHAAKIMDQNLQDFELAENYVYNFHNSFSCKGKG